LVGWWKISEFLQYEEGTGEQRKQDCERALIIVPAKTG